MAENQLIVNPINDNLVVNSNNDYLVVSGTSDQPVVLNLASAVYLGINKADRIYCGAIKVWGP